MNVYYPSVGGRALDAERNRPAPIGLAVTALVFSILGLICLPVVGPAVGIILGMVALRKLRGLRHAGGPKAMSIIAVVLGALSMLALAAMIWLGTLPALVGARSSAQR